MVDEELARDGVGMLGTAAAMLAEDAHDFLVTVPPDAEAARIVAERLALLGADLTALGGAAAVLTRSGRTSLSPSADQPARSISQPVSP